MADRIVNGGGGKAPAAGAGGTYVEQGTTATLDYSFDKETGVFTITVGGTPVTPAWNRWETQFLYGYTAEENINYVYQFEAWTASGTRTFNFSYFWVAEINQGILPDYFNKDIDIDGTRTTYTVIGNKIPAGYGGSNRLAFSCADQTGTFYIKIISITPTATAPVPQYTLNGAETGWILVSADGVGGSVVIPATIDGKPVVAIDDSAFAGSAITSVSIPASVTSIGNNAFDNCQSLTTVTFTGTSGLTSIGWNAFSNCRKLTSISIPSGVTTIQWNTFSSCSSLTSITMPGVTEILGAFWGCSSLTSITIPAGQTTIYDSTFYGSGLTSITIPASVKYISGNAFANSTYLASVTFTAPSQLTEIREHAFYNTGLTSFVIPATVTRIEGYAFRDSTHITSITIPATVTYVGERAFYGWTSSQTIYLENGTTGWSTTWQTGCNANVEPVSTLDDDDYDLVPGAPGDPDTYKITTYTGTETDVVIPSMYQGLYVTEIGDDAFKDNTDITRVVIPASIKTIGDNAFEGCTELTTFVISSGSQLETIGGEAFKGAAITVITIPASVINVGISAFDGWTAAQVIAIEGDPTDPQAAGDWNAGWDTNCSATIYYMYATEGLQIESYEGSFIVWKYEGTAVDVVIPSGIRSGGTYLPVTVIGYGAFNWMDIESITIPETVTSIREIAFYNCTALTTVTFTGTSQLETIGVQAFNGSGLTDIEIPASVTSIGNSAFANCKDLTDVAFEAPSTLETIGSSVFNNSGLTEIEIPASVISIGDYAFANCKDLEEVTFTGTSQLETIGNQAFNNSGLTEIVIPASVTSIGISAFNGCEDLTDVTFEAPSTLETIGSSAFLGCTGVTAIEIPATVTEIGTGAFNGWVAAQTITINGYANVTDADEAFGAGWRNGCNAVITYVP